ncbi:MAG: Mut7-C RNAse domain-containing protein [Thermodesulforhabdaceae bacterium]|jgi:uncharacterized protein with PIN domain
METRQDESKYRFVVDTMLGKMAKWLRIMGWDTIVAPLKTPDQIKSHVRDGRTVITRARKWHKIKGVVCLTANNTDEQLRELFSILNLGYDPDLFLARCVYCNQELSECSREYAHGKVPEYVWNTVREFFTCPSCGKIYWQGTHVSRMYDHIKNWLNIEITKKGGIDHDG